MGPEFGRRSRNRIFGFAGLTYLDRPSPLQAIHPLVKLTGLFFFTLCAFTSTTLQGGAILFILLLLGYRGGNLGWDFFFQKLRFILIFSLFILLVQILWVKEGYLLFQLEWGRVQFSVWSEGVWGGLAIVFRFLNVIGSSFLFVATTDPNRLGYAIMEGGLPYRLGFVLITALRFIPVFFQDLDQVKSAQMAKGIELEGLSPKKFLAMVKYLFIPLIISALSRIDTLTISMEGRGFGYDTKRTFLISQKLTWKDKVTMVVFPLLFLLFLFLF